MMKRTHKINKISALVRAVVAKINRDPNNSKRAMTAAGRALSMRVKTRRKS